MVKVICQSKCVLTHRAPESSVWALLGCLGGEVCVFPMQAQGEALLSSTLHGAAASSVLSFIRAECGELANQSCAFSLIHGAGAQLLPQMGSEKELRLFGSA